MAYKSPALNYFEWQQPVLDKDLVDPPGGETKGDRYLIDGIGINAWAGEDGNIATYNGAGWDFTDKKEGMFVYVMDEDIVYLYIAAWAVYAPGGDVTAALNLTDLAVVRGDGGTKGVKTSTMLISDAGEMTNPSQPAFLARLSIADNNVTGGATVYRLGSGNVLTEIFDQGGNFNVNGTFTAPVTGRYLLKTCINFDGINFDPTNLEIRIVTSNRTYRIIKEGGGLHSHVEETRSGSTFADMDANDTATVTAMVDGADDRVDIQPTIDTHFSGALLC